MASVIHFKFKSQKDFKMVTFDGLSIRLGDLKVLIVEKARLGKAVDFDLQLSDPQTKEGTSCCTPHPLRPQKNLGAT